MFGESSRNLPEADVVFSSRVRLARNLNKYPFPFRMNDRQCMEVIDKVKDTVFSTSYAAADNFAFFDISGMEPIERQALVEKHLISPDLAAKQTRSGVIISKDEKISIMINEEDHLRIQCLHRGMQLDKAWENCKKLDAMLEEKIDFAYDNNFGYLTCCPTNVGTGMRASVMLHLPALVMTGYIREILEACSKLNVAVRGIYGEKSDASGNMFQISNQITLGLTEEEIISSISNISSQIIQQERTLRAELYRQNSYRFEDRVFRSYGLVTNARILSSEEAMKLLSDVRLGVDMGIIKDVDIDTLDEIMDITQPANLQKITGRALSAGERDVKRAEIIRNRLRKRPEALG